jgi:hypothetical protein
MVVAKLLPIFWPRKTTINRKLELAEGGASERRRDRGGMCGGKLLHRFLPSNRSTQKERERQGLGLKWPPFGRTNEINNNQPILGVDVRGCIGEEARPGHNVQEDAVLLLRLSD